jgi:uncharacterized protein YjbI with pentapeptide repeats
LGVNFSECSDFLFSVKFDSCVLDYASFVRKKLLKTRFTGCSIKHVDFTECDLTKSLFINTDLMGTVFYRTVLKEVNFTSAFNFTIDPVQNNIKKAIFSQAGLAGLLDKYEIVVE